MFVEPYLFYNGRCEEALDFYAKAVDAQIVMKMRFSESPDPPPPGMVPPGFENKIMHSLVKIGKSKVMASDGCEPEAPPFSGFSLALNVETEAEADRVFA